MKRWVDNIERALRSVAAPPFATPSEGASSTSRCVGQAAPSFLDLLFMRYEAVPNPSILFDHAMQKAYGDYYKDITAEAHKLGRNRGIEAAMQDLTVLALLQAVCDGSILSLELDSVKVQNYSCRITVEHMLAKGSILDVIPAYSSCQDDALASGKWFSTVESGTRVICPRVLAEEKIGTADSRLLTILPGSLAKDGAVVTGFFPDPQLAAPTIPLDIRDVALPADASYSRVFQYFYAFEEGDRRCFYSVWAAGHPLNVDRLFRNIVKAHHYSSRLAIDGESAKTKWRLVAPQSNSGFNKTLHYLFLTHMNDAGRLLALSNCSQSYGVGFCPEEEDHVGAMRYAQHSGLYSLIL